MYNPPQKMNSATFITLYEQLTPRQKEVLMPFLSGKDDNDIADGLHCTRGNVRLHLSKIARRFMLSEGTGDRYREELVDIFWEHRRDWVSSERAKWAGILLDERQGSYEDESGLENQVIPDTPGRPVALHSPHYVQPNCYDRCCEEVLYPGQLIRIRSPQMTGKTSLLYRVLNYAREQGCHTIALNLRYDLDRSDLKSLANFLSWFFRQIAQQLESLNLPTDALPETKVEATRYLQNRILADLTQPLIIALDEVEILFDYPGVSEDFFPLLRGWYDNARKPGFEKIWERLRLVIVHSTDPYIKYNSSPLDNVGCIVSLPPLQSNEIQILANRYRLGWLTSDNIQRLITLVGGHPYLIQQAFFCLWKDKMMFDSLIDKAPTLEGIYGSHLRGLSIKLKAASQESLSDALAQVLSSETNVYLNQEQTFKLQGLGLANLDGNQVRISCELYRKFFQSWSQVESA